MTNSFSFGKLIITGCALTLALGTTACTKKSFYPYPIPTGYHYNKDKFGYGADKAEQDKKSKTAMTGEDSVTSWDYDRATAQRDSETLDRDTMFEEETVIARDAPPAVWERAANDLVSRMLTNLGTPTETIYLKAANPASPYNRSFDSALRQALGNNNLSVSPVLGGGPFALTYSVITDRYASDDLRLKIRLSASYKTANEESGLYDLTPVQDMNTKYDDETADTGTQDAPVMLQP